MGQPVSNSFRYFKPDGTTRSGVSFAYWTAPLFDPAGPAGADRLTPEMINENGKIAPAPWVPFTRAGCDVGVIGTANTCSRTPRSTSRPSSARLGRGERGRRRIPGRRSRTSSASASTAPRDRRVCGASTHAKPDLLPDEPGGYSGYNGLFGAKYVNPVIHPARPDDEPRRATDQGPARPRSASPASTGCSPTNSLSGSRRCRSPGSRSRTPTSRTPTTGTATPGASTSRTPPAKRATSSSCTTTTWPSQVLRPPGRRRDQQVEHAVPVHRGRGRPLRRLAAEQPEL